MDSNSNSDSNSGAFVATNSAGSVSSSPPVIIRASPYDSDGDDDNNSNFKTALKSNIKSDNNNGTSKNSVSSSSFSSSSSVSSNEDEDEDGGFVSGEEEFETASEPIFADPDDETLEKYAVEEEEEEEEEGAMVDALESSELPLRPIAKVSVDDEDDHDVVDEEVVENPVVRVRESGEGVGDDGGLGKTNLVGDNELKFEEKNDENGGEGDNFENASSDVVVSGNEELVEANGVKFTSQGDSVVEDINADIAEPGVVTVGEMEESKESEVTSSVEVQVGENVGLHVDEGIREIDGVKVTAEGDSVVEEIHADVVPVSGTVIVGGMDENKEAHINGSELPVIGDAAVPEDAWDIALAVGNGMVEAIVDDDKQGKATNAEASSEAELNESKVGGATDDTESGDGQKALIKDIDEDLERKVAAAMPDDDRDAKMDLLVESGTVEVVVVDDDDKRGKSMNADAFSEPKLNESIVAPVTGYAESVDVEKVPIKDDDGHPETKVDKLSMVSDVPTTAFDRDIRMEVENDSEDSVTDKETDGMIFGSSEAAKQFLEELDKESAVAETSRDNSGMNDGQIVTDSDEEVETDEEEEDGKELFDSAALAALLKAATGGAVSDNGGTVTITSQDGSRLFSVERPAGLGSSLRAKPSLAARSNHPNIFSSSGITAAGDSETNLSEEEKKKLENIQQLRVKFLRLAHRLGRSTEDSVAGQVLYRLGLVGRTSNPSFSLEAAKRMARDLEAEGKDNLSFSLNILVLGKTGVGKSATINSIFGEEKARIDAFEPTTDSVKKITGVVDGVKIHVYDTPGLRSSVMEQGTNRKILASVKSFTKKCPPDIVLYVDRLDAQTRDLNDLPLLKTISTSLGPSIWRSAIVTLTHAGSAPPDGPSGTPLTYEGFVAQRSHIVQQSVGQAVGDLRLMNPTLMNPVSLVENHPSCRKNRDGQKVLPNGQAWRPQLLLLCYSMKILSEASSLSKPQDSFDPKKLFGFRMRSPPLPYLLSWLLQSRTHPKLSPDQGGDNGDSDVDLDELSDSEGEEEEDEYDQLPPFKPLKRSQTSKLNKEQRKAYFEEYDYRVKLLQKKQWREELKRMRESKKKGNVTEDMVDDADQDAPAAVPVPLPDMVLPPSFDCDNPAYRYRFLEPTSDFLARPVLDTHGWDHDCGYDGVNVEQSLAIAGKFPGALAIQLTKDKKEFSIHLDSSVAAKHGENGSSMVGFDIQNVGKQLAYVVRGETKFKNFRKNKTAAGVSVTFLGENIVPGIKVEDQIALGKRFVLVGSTGTVRSQNDAAYGANLEVRLKEADFPIGQDQSALTLSLVKWRGDLALAANLQSQFSVGRGSKVAARVQLNNKLSGQITIRTSTSDQLQIALLGIIPTAVAIYKSLRPRVIAYSWSCYNLEVRLKEADFPIGQDQSALTLSLVKWRGDLALATNLQSQFSVGRGSKVAARVQLNNKLSGQITIRTSTSDQLQIALLGIIPTAVAIYKSLWPRASENYSIH